MACSLPSYQSAISRDPWPIIAPYIRPEDLSNASLATKRTHAALKAQLWESPAPYFCLYDRSFVAGFAQFLQCIAVAREATRHSVKYLDLHFQGFDLQVDLQPTWLSNVFTLLPRLQGLCLDGLPYLDHRALSLLRRGAASDLVYLSLRSCSNLTQLGFQSLLRAAPGLLVLNVSYCRRSALLPGLLDKDTLADLRDLRCAGLGLDDEAVEDLADKFGTRLRTLDLGYNMLSDGMIDLLLNHCILPPPYASSSSYAESQTTSSKRGAPWAATSSSLYQALDVLAGGLKTYRQIDDLVNSDHRAEPTGLANLCASGSGMSIEPMINILRTCRLQTLHLADCSESMTLDSLNAQRSDLICALSHHGGALLRSLEIDFDLLFDSAPSASARFRLTAMIQLCKLRISHVPSRLPVQQVRAYLADDNFGGLLRDALVLSSPGSICATAVQLGELRIRFMSSQRNDSCSRAPSQSVTGHVDGENYVAARQSDFSFFDDDCSQASQIAAVATPMQDFRAEIQRAVKQLRKDARYRRTCKITLEYSAEVN